MSIFQFHLEHKEEESDDEDEDNYREALGVNNF